MHLKRPVVFVVLFALFLASLATRIATRDRLESPYFKGESAMVYAHALSASEGTPLDTLSAKANHPDGYTPARYRADGFESAWAAAFRGARFVSEVDGRDFARRAVMFLTALCVFTMYALARRVWNCQAAGLLAAFLVAFLAPFVLATNGRVFTHTTLAPFFDSAHALAALVTLRATSRRGLVTNGIFALLTSLVLAVSWEPGIFVLAIWSAGVVLMSRNDEACKGRLVLLGAHALAVLLACALSPHLIATRAIASWATLLVVTSAAVIAVPRVLTRPPVAAGLWFLRASIVLLAATSLLWVLLTPVRAGASEQFPAWSYLGARLRFLFGRPESADSLSGWMRHVWSLDHAPLAPHIAIPLLLPIVLLAVALVFNRELRARRILIVLVSAAVAVLVDRSILPVATIALIVVASGAAHSLTKSWRLRAPLVALAVLITITSVVFRGSNIDAPYQIARAAGVAGRDPSAFVWVSFENTDRELVRFIATRTSVRESILAPDDLSALLLAFTGRSVTALPGATSKAPAERHVAMTGALYASEEALFQACRTAQINYVVYSIDVLLDTGRYSPRYLAGAGPVDPASIAYQMHFEPESLRRFTLLYENDHYRLFQVTGTPQPIFATDHPPFFQTDLLAKANRDIDAFRQLVIDVMLTYSDAVIARTHGNAEGARRRLEWCLLQAPRYTQARFALADAYMDLDRTEDARRLIAGLIEYAPDNTQALYYGAYLSAQLGMKEDANRYLILLLSIERDPQLIQRARTLQSAVERGIPIGRGAPAAQG